MSPINRVTDIVVLGLTLIPRRIKQVGLFARDSLMTHGVVRYMSTHGVPILLFNCLDMRLI